MTARNPDSSSELGGSLLLAHPSLRDENFKHTVIQRKQGYIKRSATQIKN
jgi:hypothetical protein